MNRFFKILVILTSYFLCYVSVFAQASLNLDFESRNYGAILPKNWYVSGEGYSISLDSIERHAGRFSLKMETTGVRNNNFGVLTGTLPIETFAGKKLEYRGWIKTKGVRNGYAGLWFRVDGERNASLGFDNMQNRGLKGDNNWTQASIKMDVSKDAKKIVFGGLFPGEGTVWFEDLELFVNGEKFIDIIEPEPKTSLSQNEIATLKKYIYPLRTYKPDEGDTKDLKALDQILGDSKVVALGEVTHGSSEIYKMKNRIIQYLATNNRFDIFSIEANMPESYKVSDYAVRGEGDPKKLIAGMYFWTWRTEEVLNMVEWMRKFNQSNPRIEFTGFDMQSYNGPVNELLFSFKGNKEAENKTNELKKLLDVIMERSKKNRGMISTVNNEVKEIDALIAYLKKSIETSSFQAKQKTWLMQNIVIIQQFLGNSNSLWRDKCMADNFLWIKNQNPNSKFIIWAHNGHIMKTNQKMGAHLAEKLGNDYVTFGFAFFNGNYTATGSKGLTSYDAVQAYPGTLEYLLEQLKEPIFILDLKKIKSENHKDTEWIRRQIDYRRVGAMGGMQNEFSQSIIVDDFDYLIFIKTSSPSTLFTSPQ